MNKDEWIFIIFYCNKWKFIKYRVCACACAWKKTQEKKKIFYPLASSIFFYFYPIDFFTLFSFFLSLFSRHFTFRTFLFPGEINKGGPIRDWLERKRERESLKMFFYHRRKNPQRTRKAPEINHFQLKSYELYELLLLVLSEEERDREIERER